MIKFLAQLFRGLHYIVGISSSPPGTSDRTFVVTWLGGIAFIAAFFVILVFYIISRLDDLLNYLDGSIDALLLDTLPLKAVITPLVKMYALVTQETGMATSPIAADVTDTEVVTLACALLRAQGLNPFDLAISFSLGGGDAKN